MSREKIVFVSGNFNILHPGHLRLLKFAKESGDKLYVGLFSDEVSPQGLIKEEIRVEALEATSYVDKVLILNSSVEEYLLELKPDIVVKGKEYEEKYNPELEVINHYGGKLLFSSGEVKFSSLDLLQDEIKISEHSTIKKSYDFLTRNNLAKEDLKNCLKKFDDLKIVVIGDIIVDEYITCEALGMSKEDPTIVVSPIKNDTFLGGAGIVAAHAAGLGADVDFYSIVGKDKLEKFISEKLSEYRVNSHVYFDETRPTTLKQRFRAQGKTLLRVNNLKQHNIRKELQDILLKDLISQIEKKGCDLVVFSDFNYGVLPQRLVETVTDYCVKNNIKIVADSQSSSQVGDISRYNNCDLLTPTEHEVRIALNDKESGLVVLAEDLRQKTKAKNIFVTLASEGMLIHATDKENSNFLTDKLSAFNKSPKDVSGAGDSLFVVSSMAYSISENIWLSSYLGSIAAACQVGRVGNIPLTQDELFMELD